MFFYQEKNTIISHIAQNNKIRYLNISFWENFYSAGPKMQYVIEI